ncbi:Rhodanese-like domain-containing protein [Gaertneriomyces semiglobifer]|nr:Rhodanese-like domain-containing protein [Gaertneriomyces semiglobifer]
MPLRKWFSSTASPNIWLHLRRPIKSQVLCSAGYRLFTASSLRFIKQDELASTLNDSTKTAGKDFLIVDVREPWDYATLHIKSAINIPSPQLMTLPAAALVDRVRTLNRMDAIPKTVMFHCKLSLIRGPTCAVRFGTLLKQVETTDKGIRDETVIAVLDGGFKAWETTYGHDPNMVEGTAAPAEVS